MANIFKPKRSSTAAKVPTTTDLASGEIGVNMADQKIYINNGTSVVQVGTGKLSGAVDVTLTSLTSGQVLSWNGTAWVNSTAGTGTVTGVTATAPVVSSGGTAPVISMAAATASVNGYMTSTYAAKLDGIAAGATANTGTVTSVSGTGTASGLTLSGTVTTSGNLTLSGTVNALAAGTYAVSISGNAATATSSPKVSTSDLRSTSLTPNYFGQGLNTAFMSNSTDGLSDGGTYHGIVQFQQWSDSSGGGSHQIGFTDNNNIWHRGSSGALTSWGSWYKLLDSNNYNSYSPTLTGTGASGTWGINVTGSAGSVAWSGVTGKPTTLSGYGITDAAPSTGSTSITTLGTVATGTWNATNIALGKGGTNAALTAVNGGIVYSNASAMAITAAGTAGQALISAGAAAPVWTTLTLENLPDAAFKKSVRAATTADLAAASSTATTLTGGLVALPVIDGITLALNDRVLVKNQTSSAQNGIYKVTTLGVAGTTAWVLTRTADADTASEIAGAAVNVDSGTVNGGAFFDCDFKTTDTLGTTPIVFSRIVDTSYLGTWTGSTAVTTLGTIATGTWNASTISVAKGGTGATTLTGLVYGNGTSAMTAATAAQIVSDIGTTAVENATNATNVGVTNDVATASSVYLAWVGATSGNNPVKISNTKLTMVPSTGTVTSAGNFVANSDETLKTNWRPVADDFVSKLAGVKSGVYDRVDIDLTQAGVSAQSLQKVLPETVEANDDGILSVSYGNAALVAAIELAKEVVNLRRELAELKARV